jgi:uncharacterized protein (TIGR00645 family)
MTTEKLLLKTRYLLVPMSFGLLFAMLLYDYAFFKDLWELFKSFFTAHDTEEMRHILLIGVLGLLDALMVANLIIMIMIGSHSIFVQEITNEYFHKGKMPRFLKGLTSGMLKAKMGSSLVSVSSIHLLAAFMDVEKTPWEDLNKKLIIHGAFIVSALVFAFIEIKFHPPECHETPKNDHDQY